MTNRFALRDIALAIASAGLVSACQPTTPHPTPQDDAARAAADASAAQLAALEAKKQARATDTAEEAVIVHRPDIAGALNHQIEAIPAPVPATAPVTPGDSEAMRKAVAAHAAESKPVQGLRP